MKHTHFVAVLLAAILIPVQFADAFADGPLEGRWTGTSGDKNDIPVTLTVKGSSLLLEITLPSGHAFPIRGEFNLDTTAQPAATLDIRKMKGPDDETIPDIKGLLRIEADSVKMCLSDPGGTRPESVEKVPESGGSLMTLKRAEKK
jgi:uncharacterized protein (TIGR03067 family)